MISPGGPITLLWIVLGDRGLSIVLEVTRGLLDVVDQQVSFVLGTECAQNEGVTCKTFASEVERSDFRTIHIYTK